MNAQSVFRSSGTDDDTTRRGGEFWKILKYYSNKGLLAMTVLFSLICGVLPLVNNIFMGDFMNTMNASTNFMDGLKDVLIKMACFCCGMIIAMGLNFGLRAHANPAFMLDLRKLTYDAFMEKDIAYYDQSSTGVLVGRLSQDITLIHEIFIDKVLNVVQNLAQSLGGLILALITCWQVGLPCVAVIIVCALVYYFGDKVIDKIWEAYNESSSNASAKAEEAITSFRTIRSMNTEDWEADLYKKSLTEVDNVFKKTSIAQGIKDFLITILLNLMTAGLLYYASWFIIERPEYGYKAGDLMILLMCCSFATMGISSALSLSDDFRKASVSAAKILEIIETPPAVDRKEGGELDRVCGKIEFRDVGFKYPGTDTWAVRHLNLLINAGQTVALVGESGCGKSTTLQLLQRFYEINEGTILIDDVDIRSLSAKYVRSQISIVPQSPVLFSMNVLDNIKYSKANATEQEVAEAANIGNAHNFIMELPDNYHARVHQSSLSGGQKQRICISRAILANAPILLLDEATAALDTESEQLVQESLERFRHGKTAIMVAHRLATVINADRIFVFEAGHVVEEGNHQELLEKGGIYADLVKFQLQ